MSAEKLERSEDFKNNEFLSNCLTFYKDLNNLIEERGGDICQIQDVEWIDSKSIESNVLSALQKLPTILATLGSSLQFIPNNSYQSNIENLEGVKYKLEKFQLYLTDLMKAFDANNEFNKAINVIGNNIQRNIEKIDVMIETSERVLAISQGIY